MSPQGALGWFADQLLTVELPDLPLDRRTDTVRFVCRRAAQMPSPLRSGVVVLSASAALTRRILGGERTVSSLQNTSLPFVAELARMVRSLAFAFVWESWPDTSPTGAPA